MAQDDKTAITEAIGLLKKRHPSEYTAVLPSKGEDGDVMTMVVREDFSYEFGHGAWMHHRIGDEVRIVLRDGVFWYEDPPYGRVQHMRCLRRA